MSARGRKKRAGEGMAYLIGAGPGDPGLITVRGRELLDSADAIVYDSLANPALLPTGPRPGGAARELFDVGKRGGDRKGSVPQEEINEILVGLVRDGKKVVRLKGGDPFVFGRGSEEAQALVESQLPFEVVPGVTAGIAAAAYAGIPVTHRGLSASVTFVTGHEDPEKSGMQVDWQALAKNGGTIVLYMGVRTLPKIAEQLMSGGMPGEIPAAAIQWGTYPRQRTVVATLETLASRAAEEGITAPVITVIGWTVVLRDEIAWFDQRPLFGRHILVTRAGEGTGSGLGDRLQQLGATVTDMPATKLVQMPAAPLRDALTRLAEYDWVVFTSRNAVRTFFGELIGGGGDARRLAGARVCAVGPATAEELFRFGIVIDVRAKRFVAEGILEALEDRDDVSGARVLYPCAEGARETLQVGLEQMGATVDRVHIYRSVPDDSRTEAIRELVASGAVDIVTFTSASAVRAYASAVGEDLVGSVEGASIGPITSGALYEFGIPVMVESSEATLDSMAASIVRAVSGEADDFSDVPDDDDVEVGDDDKDDTMDDGEDEEFRNRRKYGA